MDDRPSLVRELAHELRDALSPIRAAIDLLRLRNFDTDVSRRMAEKVDRGLDAALAAVDAFVAADQCENGTLTVEVAPTFLDQVVEAARTALGDRGAGGCGRLRSRDPGTFFHRDAGLSRRELVRELRHACPGQPDGAAHGAPGHGAAARKPGSHPALA